VKEYAYLKGWFRHNLDMLGEVGRDFENLSMGYLSMILMRTFLLQTAIMNR